MTRSVMRVLLVSILWVPLASAQGLPVYDDLNHVVNSVTALQSTISAVQSVIHTAKWVLDQTGLEELAMGGEWVADMQQMQQLVQEAQALGYDLQSMSALLQSTFSLDSAPDNTTDLQLRLREIRQHVSTSYTYALRTQALIMTALRTVGHIQSLYAGISALIGNLSAQENISQQLTKLQQLASEQKVTSTAFERAQSLDRLTEPLILESLDRINEAIMVDHPR